MHAIAATTCAPNHIDIFYLEPNFSMAHKFWDGTQWRVGWDQLGGDFSTVPAAVATRARPQPPGGAGAAGGVVAEIVILKCRADVFAVGTDFVMYHLTLWDGVLAPGAQWSSLGGIFTSAPTAIAWQGSRIDLFGSAPTARCTARCGTVRRGRSRGSAWAARSAARPAWLR